MAVKVILHNICIILITFIEIQLSTDEHIYISLFINFKMDKELSKTCGKLIPNKNFARPLKSHSDDKKFSCFQCSKRFKTKDKLNCHQLKTIRKLETKLINSGKM